MYAGSYYISYYIKNSLWLAVIAIISPFLLHFFSTSYHTLCKSAFFYQVHSKIRENDLHVLDEPSHELLYSRWP